MQSSTRLLFFLLLTSFQLSHAQKLVDVTNEILTVNSQTAMNGYTRNVTEIQLPKGTTGYTYRISVARRGGRYAGNSLLSLLQAMPITQLGMGANLAQFAINQSDGSQIDFFIFTTQQDKDAFFTKSENWSYCRSFLNRVNTCGYVDKCLNETVWFGFRNNNFSQGLDVRLEVVALVDEQSSDQTYSFEISNKTTADMRFEVSADGLDWRPCLLRTNYTGRFKFTRPSVTFRMTSETGEFVRYKIYSTERYAIKWSESKQRWDLFNY